MWFYHVSLVVMTCILLPLFLFFSSGPSCLISYLYCVVTSVHFPSFILVWSPHLHFFFVIFSFLSVFILIFPLLLFFFLPSTCLLSFPLFPLLSTFLPLFTSPLLSYFSVISTFTPLSILSCSSPLSSYLLSSPLSPLPSHQACEIPETAVFSLAPSEESSVAKPCSVPCWDLLQTSVQGMVEFPVSLRQMLFSLFPRPDNGVGSAEWSLPAPIRPDFPRQSLSVPVEADSGGGLSSRWVKQSIWGSLAVTVHLELGTEPRLAHDIKRGGTVAGHS